MAIAHKVVQNADRPALYDIDDPAVYVVSVVYVILYQVKSSLDDSVYLLFLQFYRFAKRSLLQNLCVLHRVVASHFISKRRHHEHPVVSPQSRHTLHVPLRTIRVLEQFGQVEPS